MLFLYSRRNLAGASLALGGLAAYFAGLIGTYWYFIVPGLYGIGWMLVPKSQVFDLGLQTEMDSGEIRAALHDLIQKIHRHVPKEVLAKVESIQDSILEIVPRLKDAGADARTVHTVRETALAYLPAALQAYLNLPKAYATLHTVKDGKTSRAVLLDQMELLDKAMKDILVTISGNDSQKLIAHGRFLEAKFRKDELTL